jgi:ribosomal protein S18 acetylase RimI-like enzyme
MNIRKLTPEDWEMYKKIRLEALQKDASAFGSSYDESVGRTDEEWKKKLERPKSFVFAIEDGSEHIGMAAAYQEEGEIVSHVAYVWGVYVRESFRGKGIGKKLLKVVLDEIQRNPKIEKANLNVNKNQIAAVKLYESLGFQIAGTLHRELKVNGEYFDEYVMEKIF